MTHASPTRRSSDREKRDGQRKVGQKPRRARDITGGWGRGTGVGGHVWGREWGFGIGDSKGRRRADPALDRKEGRGVAESRRHAPLCSRLLRIGNRTRFCESPIPTPESRLQS